MAEKEGTAELLELFEQMDDSKGSWEPVLADDGRS